LIAFFFVAAANSNRALRPFPTRRSSDLALRHPPLIPAQAGIQSDELGPRFRGDERKENSTLSALSPRARSRRAAPASRCPRATRSEEHTSELQSQSNLVCRLLLEKKKRQ